METIYDWLYENYYKPHAEEIFENGPEQEIAAAAERLLLTGEGGSIERQDAVNTLLRLNGTAAFAAGVCFGSRLFMDAGFIAPIALGGMSIAI